MPERGNILHLPDGRAILPADVDGDSEIAEMPLPEKLAAIQRVIAQAHLQRGEARMNGIIIALGGLAEIMLSGFVELGSAHNQAADAIEELRQLAGGKRGPLRGRGIDRPE